MKRQLVAGEEALGNGAGTSRVLSKFSRLGKCEVCAAHEARYACPKCEVKTCCVGCVQIHKKELECDGIRDRTKFLPLREMTKMDFMSDYYLLEEATRYVQNRKDDPFKRYTRYNKALPPHLSRLRHAAFQRKTKLRFLLQHFARHKHNTTYFDWNQQKIYWRVEWVFVNAAALQFVDERCAEDVPLAQLLDKYLNAKSLAEVPQRKALEYYQSVDVYSLKVLLKAEGIKRCGTRYYQMDVGKSLRENLAGKTLVEYPCVHISYERDAANFDIIDSDEDVETEAQNYQAALDAQHKASLAELARRQDGSEEEPVAKTIELSKAEREAQRKRKREEYDRAPNKNLLFADESMWDVLSSSSDEELETKT